MIDFSGNTFIYNKHVLPCSDFDPELFQTGASVYEVVRIIDKKPLFLEEHLERFQNSARLKGCKFWLSAEQIKSNLFQLIASNNIANGNIKLVFTYMTNATQEGKCFLAYFVKHHYPTEREYERGIEVVSMTAERPNPNAKVAFKELRTKANDIIKRQEVYEVILVDKKGFITEGSRSNIFFVQDGEIFTPPSHHVLQGITREKVIQICKDLDIPLHEESIAFKYAPQFDSAFITGTSPMVLPIKKLDGHTYEMINGVINAIRNTYRFWVKTDISD